MLGIGVSLRHLRGTTAAVDAYKVASFKPGIVFDFENEKYFTDSLATTFDSAITHSASSNATMVDSDGLLKWRPHNLALNSATPATQSITVVSGADYTVECTGVSIALSGAGTGTVTEGNPVTITASTTTLTLTVTGSTGTMWAYRSDLGGMVNNPDRGDSYVPTTSAARYLARRGHHVYNGSEWVNEGVLVESEQRVNLLPESNDFTVATGAWNNINVTTTGTSQGPDGVSDSATQMLEAATTGEHQVGETLSFSPATSYTLSAFVNSIGGRDCTLFWFTNSANTILQASFDLTSGTVLSGPTASGSAPPTNVAARIEKVGNFYRVSISGLTGGTAGGGQARIHASEGATFNYAGDVTKGLEVYGAQLEAGSTPSSYIPTSGSTVTRAADTLTVPSANLPWPAPNVIGEELVTNGTFDTDLTGWTATAPATATWNAGQVDLARNIGSSVQNLFQTFSISLGSVYEVSIDVLSLSNSVYLFSTGGGVAIGNAITTTGTHKRYFVGKSGDNGIYVGLGGSITATATIDNISVREIDPLAVSIQMQGRMTYADTGVDLESQFFRWYIDTSNRIDARLTTTGSITGQINFRQSSSGTTYTVSSGVGAFTPGTNVPFNIASRHGSTFINGAVDGTALTADTTPTALPDLSTTDLSLAYSGGPMILKRVRIWADDLGDAGIAEASA